MTNTPSDAEIEKLAKRHGATSYRNRADTQHPAYGFTEDGLNGLIDEVLAKWGSPQQVVQEPFCYVSVNKRGDITRVMKWKDQWTNIPLYTTPQPAQVQPVVREPLTCEWTHNDDDGYWDTSCGKAWRFDDGGPKENNMNFCHCCGKTLRIKGKEAGNVE